MSNPISRSVLQRALVVALAVAALVSTQTAAAGARDAFPLHPGSHGQRVSDLQWLLAGHRPNVFTQVKPTFKHPPNGSFGARTTAALTAYRYRIGYPRSGQCGAKTNLVASSVVTGYFFNILKGKAARPACWVALAASRVKAINAGATAAALRIRAYELHLVTLGIHEVPDGSNRGPAISTAAYGVPALQSATGAYGQAWCVSTQQTIFKLLGYGTFADATAGVYATSDYYAKRKRVFAKAKVGALVDFVNYDRFGHRIPGTGHQGFVTDVYANSFSYTAGNDGNRFQKHTITFGSRSYLFVYVPGIA